MKKLFIIFLALSLSFPLLAQQRTGNIYGKVIDSEGSPLPGVNVTLTGSVVAPMVSSTSAEGLFRFLSLSPAKDYALKAELQGFKSRTESGIIVTVGTNVEITLVMELGALTEEVTVTATTPVVDSKKTTLNQTINQDTLQSLPSARDPWVVLQMAPTVMLDRENVGGSESGNQSKIMSSGSTGDNVNVWSMDGAVITDVSSAGSPIYYDFDSFEEMSVSVGANDVSIQTGGVAINIVTKRGGNKTSLGGRFYVTDSKFQANNLTDELRKEGITNTNRIQDIRDYGFNFGGPFVKDKAWYWISYGVQDIKSFNILNAAQNTQITAYNGKLNLQLLPQNRLEVFGSVDKKEMFGRDASYSRPLGSHQVPLYHFGTPIFKIQDEHMFGDNLFVSAKWIYVESGWGNLPMGNEDSAKIGRYNVATGVWEQASGGGPGLRTRKDASLLLNYFNDNLFGMSHEVKFGLDYSWRGTDSKSDSYAQFYYNYNTPQIDINGDKVPDIVENLYQVRTTRYALSATALNHIAPYFSDTITKGRFNLILGIRYDKQSPKSLAFPVLSSVHKDHISWQDNFTGATADAINKVLPTFQVGEVDPKFSWNVWSPRLGLTWDVQGNNKTIAKLSVAQYGDTMMTGEASNFRPLGTGGYMYFWWLDDDKNKIADYKEFYWHDSKTFKPYRVFDDAGNFIGNWNNAKNIMWGSFDPLNPTQTTDPTYTLSDTYGSSRTQEAILSLEREISADMGISINVLYRKYDRTNWNLDYYPKTGYARSKDDYVQVGVIPDHVGPYSTGESAGKPYYLLKGDQAATSYIYKTRNEGYNVDFYGANFGFVKRLTNKWMLNASLSLQSQKVHYGENGYLNPTNLWAIDNRLYAAYEGGSGGKIEQYVFSPWMVKVSALYQLPFDINVGLTVTAREGNRIAETFTINDINAPNPRNRSLSVYVKKFGNDRLPTFMDANLRVEKAVVIQNLGRIYLMADVFNVFNNSVINRRYQKNYGTYYVHNGSFVPDPTYYMANEVLNPLVARFGIRFQF